MKIVTILFAAALAIPATAYAQADDYPPCSATVTDHCMQHEGHRAYDRHHHMMHHRHHHHHK